MNIFYRGYVIREDIRSICYTVYGRRPAREELASCLTAAAAMQWIDHHVTGQLPQVETYRMPRLTRPMAA